jgi:hypothetical protein
LVQACYPRTLRRLEPACLQREKKDKEDKTDRRKEGKEGKKEEKRQNVGWERSSVTEQGLSTEFKTLGSIAISKQANPPPKKTPSITMLIVRIICM